MKNVAEIADFTNHLEEFEEMVFSVHMYRCDSCELNFAVDQSFEAQSDLVCPLCCTDTHMQDIGSGEIRGNVK